ncbi:MAG: mgtE-like transporter [Actinomycetota bacterium]|jgi:mgtE-like transporter|nr:mgtE-like transporter [Actinomycetota bacterium]
MSERATIRQGFVANFISALTSLISGVVLAASTHRLQDVAGLLVLIPVSVGMRGNIFGALSARLGTSIHTGLFEITGARDKPLYQNVYSATLLTLGTSVAMALLARGIAVLVGLHTVSTWDFLAISLVGGVLSSALVLAFTVALSIASYRRGWDLDSVGAVLITVVGDVVTLPCLLLASLLVGIHIVTPVIGVISLMVGLIALVRGYTTSFEVARRIVRESFPILLLAAVLDILAGTVGQHRIDQVFAPFPIYFIFLPGFLENTGALGSILAARLGTKLHLGATRPSARPDAVAILDGTIVALLGLFIYSVTAVTTLWTAMATGADYPGAWTFLGTAMLAGILALVIAAFIGYYAAILTYRFGFDPDNHTIPLVTSGMDLIGFICLIVAVVIFGVA